MTRRVCLSSPPVTDRIEGIWPYGPLPRLGKIVVLQLYRDRRWWRLARVVEVDREQRRYNVEVIKR